MLPKCPECDGTGWFSPTIMHDTGTDRNGWECFLCGGLGAAPWPATEEEIAEERIAEEDTKEEAFNNGQFGVGA